MLNSEKKPKILIVDDVPENIELLSGTLKDQYQIMAANCGKNALKIVESEKNRPDLILLDVMMPEMDGYEMIRILKENSDTAEIPVIFITAMTETEDETKGFELGAADYIIKPIRPVIVRARVKTHLALHLQKEELRKMVRVLENKLTRVKPPKPLVKREYVREQVPEEELIDSEYFLDDHRHDLSEIIQEIDSTINLMLLKGEYDPRMIQKLGKLAERYARILELYPMFTRLGSGMRDFAEELSEMELEEQPDGENLVYAMGCLESLIYTLEHWCEQVFEGKLENPNIFDNSMISDMQTVLLSLQGKSNDKANDIEFF